MTEQETVTVTVAGVSVTIEVVDGVLAVTVGCFDPAAAGPLRISPRFGTAVMSLSIADENGDTAHRPDQLWFFDLHPDRRDSAARAAGPAGREPQR